MFTFICALLGGITVLLWEILSSLRAILAELRRITP
jgi:hypothetical protein